MVNFNDTTAINSEIIGKINCNFSGIKGKIKLGIFENVNLKQNPSDLCVLPNGNLLFANYKSMSITVYDSNLNFIKTVEKISSSYSIEPFSIVTNNFDKIYICENNHVAMTDFNFNLIKKYGSNKMELEDPRYILFHEGFLYVCDCSSMRIQKLNSDLILTTTFYLKIKPRQIQIIDKIACIIPLHDGLYFYDLNNFELKIQYDHNNGFIFVKDDIFYQFHKETMKIDCFDKYGQFIESIDLKLNHNTDYTGYFVAGIFHDKLIIQSISKQIFVA